MPGLVCVCRVSCEDGIGFPQMREGKEERGDGGHGGPEESERIHGQRARWLGPGGYFYT